MCINFLRLIILVGKGSSLSCSRLDCTTHIYIYIYTPLVMLQEFIYMYAESFQFRSIITDLITDLQYTYISLYVIHVRTWIFPGTPVDSILLATLTVLPQMSQSGLVAPITPATTGPWFRPEGQFVQCIKNVMYVFTSIINYCKRGGTFNLAIKHKIAKLKTANILVHEYNVIETGCATAKLN